MRRESPHGSFDTLISLASIRCPVCREKVTLRPQRTILAEFACDRNGDHHIRITAPSLRDLVRAWTEAFGPRGVE